MALVNAFSSLSIGVNASPSGLGFKKAVAAFAMPARVTSARSAVFEITAKQNKKARTILVRVFVWCDVRGTRASRFSFYAVLRDASVALMRCRRETRTVPRGRRGRCCRVGRRTFADVSTRLSAKKKKKTKSLKPFCARALSKSLFLFFSNLSAEFPCPVPHLPLSLSTPFHSHLQQSRNERLYNKQRKSEITTRMKKVRDRIQSKKGGKGNGNLGKVRMAKGSLTHAERENKR